MKKIFSFIAILSLLLTGCEGFDLGQTGKLEDLFSLEDLEKLDGFKAEGGRVTLPFTPDYDWEASANRSWIQISPESGVAGEEARLKITLEENTSSKEREGTIFVELSNSISYKIPVRQKAGEGGGNEETPLVELVNGAYYEIDSNGGDIQFVISTNTEYEVYIPNSARAWLEYNGSRAMHNETLLFTAQKNEDNSSRQAKVTLYFGENGEVEFTIYQEAAQQGGGEEDVILELIDGTTYNVDPNGEDIDITVYSNVDYRVEIPADASWLHENMTRAAQVSFVSLYAEKNNTGAARSALVRLTYDSTSVSFTVSQQPAQGETPVQATIAVSPRTITLGAEGGTQQITVTSNAAWGVVCTEPSVSIYPLSGNGNGSVTISVSPTTVARQFSIDFEASNDSSTAKASVAVSQSAGNVDQGMTPSDHQLYLEQVGQRLLTYFNPEDSRTLAESIAELAEKGGFDFYLEEPTRSTNSTKNVKFAKKLAASVLGLTRFSPEAAVRLSTTLILPEEDGTYSLDDYKGKQYVFSFDSGKWTESVISNANEVVAIWGTSVATLTWVEGTGSWEGFIDYDNKAKVENIPSRINFDIRVDNRLELSSVVNIDVPNNYSIDTQTNVWLNGDYNFKVCANANNQGLGGSVIISKGGETLATGGGSVAIKDMTDSNNWWQKYYCELCEMYHTDINIDYPVDQVQTGNAYVTILDVALQAQGNMRAIIDEYKKIEEYDSTYSQAALLSNTINANASALLYYTGNQEKIADVKAEAISYEDWYWDENTMTEIKKTYYDPMPVLVFTDGSKFAVDEYFTEVAFGNLIDAAEELMKQYEALVN